MDYVALLDDLKQRHGLHADTGIFDAGKRTVLAYHPRWGPGCPYAEFTIGEPARVHVGFGAAMDPHEARRRAKMIQVCADAAMNWNRALVDAGVIPEPEPIAKQTRRGSRGRQ